MHLLSPSPLESYFPCFQPIVDVSTSSVAGHEVLARTFDPRGKVVSAGWLFENENLDQEQCLAIDRHVRNQALRAFSDRSDDGMLFINISPMWIRSFSNGEIPPSLRMIRELNLDPQRVVLEITEKIGNARLLEEVVGVYRDAGVKIAIDDFGVGGSQVDRLIALNPDFLKIDMGIFKSASKGGDSANILLSLAELADRSGCEVLCEGIETEQEYHFALECGASKLQGWLFSAAEPEFQTPHRFKNLILECQNSYLNRKKRRFLDASKSNAIIEQAVDGVIEAVRKNEWASLDAKGLSDMGLLRFFLCDFRGDQISPNYEFSRHGITEIEFYKGSNWSHRPYFALLLAMNAKSATRQVVSNPYIDRKDKKLCKTRGAIISHNKVLFVDTIAENEVLYCD